MSGKLTQLLGTKPEFASARFGVGDLVYLSEEGYKDRSCRATVGIVTKVLNRSPMVEIWPLGYKRPQQFHMNFWTTIAPLKTCPMCRGKGEIAQNTFRRSNAPLSCQEINDESKK